MHFGSSNFYSSGFRAHSIVAMFERTFASRRANSPTTTGLSIILLCLTACSHAPTRPESAATTTASVVASDTASSASQPSTVDETALNEALSMPFTDTEPQTTEEAVASAVAEQNLVDRLRSGFAMADTDNVAVDREIAWFARHPDYLDRTFRRAERYLFFIVEELEARKMPLELALLPIVESAFNPVALSHARAAGLWQFIPSTGKRYGLEQNQRYDGRRDVLESTRAALDYLQTLANEFDGNWYQAVAAYNAGEMNVSRAIAHNQAKGKPTDFFNLDLPRETRTYVPKLLAIRRIVAQPEKFGLEFGHIANQPYFAKVELESPIDLGVAAQLAGLPKEDLIALNPAFNRAVANPDGSDYLLVPVDRAEKLRAGLASLSPAQRVPKIYYTVHRNDTISSVAHKLSVSQEEIRAANRMKSNALHVGQELVIDRGSMSMRTAGPEPVAGTRFVTQDPNYVPPPAPPRELRSASRSDSHTVRHGETLRSVAHMYGVSVDALAMENKFDVNRRIAKGQKLWIPRANDEGTATLATNDARSATVQRVSYVVRAGDTLMHIAKTFRVEIRELLAWNKIRAADPIRQGQKLIMYLDGARRSGS